ncbi:MAG: non-ribosomal peptide synthetase, partial [Vulcanimicrobiaceae bacterium]
VGQSGPIMLLTESSAIQGAREFMPSTIPLVDLHTDLHLWENLSRGAVESDVTAENLAYVIFTPGSTGQPKGVMLEHRNAVVSTGSRLRTYGCYERFLLVSPISFDSSVAGIFGTLASGGTLYVATREELEDARMLRALIERHSITSLLCVPALLQSILDAGGSSSLRSLQQLIVAGDVCPVSLALQAQKSEPQAAFYNEYGPTEASVWATVQPCNSVEPNRTVPIGRPISNTRVYVLDDFGSPVATGSVGELYIGGAGVARGYLGRADETAARFVVLKHIEDDRLYKTGDMVRYRSDGTLEFLGRNDAQIKIRGYRIELGEIESRLREYPGLNNVVVLAKTNGESDKRLIAFFKRATGNVEIDAESLRGHLLKQLPSYMVPMQYIEVEDFPFTVNGKIDHAALQRYETSDESRSYIEPQSETECTVAEIWRNVLGVTRVGRNDNFFALGGHSLLAMRVIERLRAGGRSADVRALFLTPTLCEFSAGVRSLAEVRL